MHNKNAKSRDRPSIREALLRIWANAAADIFFVAGAVATTIGVSLIYEPAGWITAGVLLIAGGILIALGGGGSG